MANIRPYASRDKSIQRVERCEPSIADRVGVTHRYSSHVTRVTVEKTSVRNVDSDR